MLKKDYLDITGISDEALRDRIEKYGFEGGKIKITKELKDKIQFFSFLEGGYHPLSEGNMSHIRNAVDAWNEEYYKYGPRSKQAKEFMMDPNNYYIETEYANKSEGAKLGNYRDPEVQQDQEMVSDTCKKSK